MDLQTIGGRELAGRPVDDAICSLDRNGSTSSVADEWRSRGRENEMLVYDLTGDGFTPDVVKRRSSAEIHTMLESSRSLAFDRSSSRLVEHVVTKGIDNGAVPLLSFFLPPSSHHLSCHVYCCVHPNLLSLCHWER